MQGQNQRGLCLADKAACRGDILGAEGLYKPLAPLPPAVLLGGVAQHVGRVSQNLQTPRKADIGYKVIIGRALALITQAGALGVQPQPVTVLVPGLPKAVFAALALDKLDPVLHAVVAALQNPLVAVGAVERPRQYRDNIPPERRAVLLVAHNIRHNLRHTHIGAQLAGQIAQPLGHKRHNVLVEGRRRAERGHIAGPAQTLTALGAVGGNIEEVVPLAPLNILLQPVDAAVRTGKAAGLLQVGGKETGRKKHVLAVLQPLHTQIAETVPGKMRVQRLLTTAQDIGVGRLGKTQVFGVEIAVFVQRFRVAQGQCLARLAVNFHLDPASQVLAKIIDLFTLGGGELFYNRQSLQAAHRLVLLPDNCGKTVVKQLGGLRCGRLRCKVLCFTVINFGGLNGPGGGEPILVGANPFLASVRIGDAEGGQRGGGVTVVVGLRHKAELALIPAVRQRQCQTV